MKQDTKTTTDNPGSKAKTSGAFSIDLQSYKPTLANEIESRGREYVTWGENNIYPVYLYDTYMNCPTLQSIINASIDYTVGNDIVIGAFELGGELAPDYINPAGDSLKDVVRKCIVDRWIFGGFAFEVFYNDFGNVAGIAYVNVAKCRVGTDRQYVYYLEEWKPYRACRNAVRAHAYCPQSGKEDGSQIFIYRGTKSRGIYPVCDYYAALVAAETQIEIQKFHYNSIINGFMVDGILNFNNAADVSEEAKDEVEQGVINKFCGTGNARRLMVSWNEDAEKATTFTRLSDDQFDTKYQALAETTRENLIVALRIPPVLAGIAIQTGFNTQEFEEAFRLYNRTAIKPVQTEVSDVFDKVFGCQDSITFEPFTL